MTKSSRKFKKEGKTTTKAGKVDPEALSPTRNPVDLEALPLYSNKTQAKKTNVN